MINLGFEKEVKDLFNKYSTNLKAFQAIGYKEFVTGIENNLSIDEISDNIKIHIHQYAKKQRTFLNNQFPNQIIETRKQIYNLIRNALLLKKEANLYYLIQLLTK